MSKGQVIQKFENLINLQLQKQHLDFIKKFSM